ncbi:FkbM family methyltransferase [Phaeobacter sp. HF9A]|uniref:FkbM family methyltransferase n=1 Tax=Phaeobacter sp. HF9A TaxID=2721561 RepID=UPI001430E280|nr:FkbM family methyltransferase [Phaeobacter sp. HF9A]NIZ14365.1 FkbM family methyltransferase [Phaeobacter sp. HF9A]
MARFDIGGVPLEVPEGFLTPKIAAKLASGGYERSEARAARMRVKPGLRVLELGGGVGYISSICAQITDPANILTLEANPNTLEVIRHNLDLNGATEAQLVHGAVVGPDFEEQTLLFRAAPAFWGSAVAEMGAAEEDLVEVPAIRLTDLFARHRPHVVILDVEGAEQYLFSRRWPRHVRQVIMELHPAKYDNSAIQTMVDCMSKSGLTYDPGCSNGSLIGFRRVKPR